MIIVAYRGSNSDVRFGSLAALLDHSSLMSGSERKADIGPGGMSAFTQSGHAERQELLETNGSERPAAAGRPHISNVRVRAITYILN
jgi:hypothetical protein